MRNTILFLWTALAMLGCGSQHLERSRVPILWGMRLDDSDDEAELQANLAHLGVSDSTGIMIELAIRSDSLGRPIVPCLPSAQALQLLRDARRPLSLAFANTNREELFSAERRFDDVAHKWVYHLAATLKAAIDTFRGCQLERVVLSSDLGSMQSPSYSNFDLLLGLHMRYPETMFSFGGRSEDLESMDLYKLSDEIAIDYPPVAGEEQKSPCRKENLKITEFAHNTGKPVFIYRANLIGENPVLQLKNRLRFWQEEVELSGLCINTLYAKIPARDHSSYHGLADNPDLLAFIEEYRHWGPF